MRKWFLYDARLAPAKTQRTLQPHVWFLSSSKLWATLSYVTSTTLFSQIHTLDPNKLNLHTLANCMTKKNTFYKTDCSVIMNLILARFQSPLSIHTTRSFTKPLLYLFAEVFLHMERVMLNRSPIPTGYSMFSPTLQFSMTSFSIVPNSFVHNSLIPSWLMIIRCIMSSVS